MTEKHTFGSASIAVDTDRGSKMTNRKRWSEIAQAKAEFLENLDTYGSWVNGSVSSQLGVSLSVVKKWRKEAGLVAKRKAKHKDISWAVVSHPMFGKVGENAPCASSVIAKEIGCGKDKVAKLRGKHGVIQFAKPLTGRKFSRAITGHYVEAPSPLAPLLDRWKRPVGVGELLNEIRQRNENTREV
jgi:hypothetical protein